MTLGEEKPAERANRKAKDEKIFDQKRLEPIGTDEAEKNVAEDLNEAARHDTKK